MEPRPPKLVIEGTLDTEKIPLTINIQETDVWVVRPVLGGKYPVLERVSRLYCNVHRKIGWFKIVCDKVPEDETLLADIVIVSPARRSEVYAWLPLLIFTAPGSGEYGVKVEPLLTVLGKAKTPELRVHMDIENAVIMATPGDLSNKELIKRYKSRYVFPPGSDKDVLESLYAYVLATSQRTSSEEAAIEGAGEEAVHEPGTGVGEYVVIEGLYVSPSIAESVRELLVWAAREGLAYKTRDGKLVLRRDVYEKLLELGAVPA